MGFLHFLSNAFLLIASLACMGYAVASFLGMLEVSGSRRYVTIQSIAFGVIGFALLLSFINGFIDGAVLYAFTYLFLFGGVGTFVFAQIKGE